MRPCEIRFPRQTAPGFAQPAPLKICIPEGSCSLAGRTTGGGGITLLRDSTELSRHVNQLRGKPHLMMKALSYLLAAAAAALFVGGCATSPSTDSSSALTTQVVPEDRF